MEKTKILYVDDDPIHICLVCGIMGDSKFEVVPAASAEEAISILKRDPELKIVISDWIMPEMNGLELVKYIKNIYPEIVCYMITSCLEVNRLFHYEKEGIIKKIFKKPVNRYQLLSEMEDASNVLLVK